MTQQSEPARLSLRPPDQVMRLSRLGSFHQSRLSFMRILLRRVRREGWTFTRPVFDIDKTGVGHAIYRVDTGVRAYSLIAFAHDLPAEKRSDRVIAEAWDATFTLFDGDPTEDDITRLAANVPLQEAGRISQRELSLSRANRSVRLWAHVVDRLASGQQPDLKAITDVGYLMRTTAVYGSGKFGAADYPAVSHRPEFSAPFQIEMLSVYLTRCFVRDLVEHMARTQSPDAAKLDKPIARALGIGNSTGLGMAPFLVNHPGLLNNWITARETAIARVLALPSATEVEAARFRDLLARSCISADIWSSDHPIQIEKLTRLRADLARLKSKVEGSKLKEKTPWQRLFDWSVKHLGEDAQECLASLMLEPYGHLVDDLADTMSDDCEPRIDGAMRIDRLRSIIEDVYPWALDTDFEARENCARAWYVSEEKLEPRLGERFDEPIAPYEQPLAPGRDAAALFETLRTWRGDAPVAELLLKHPEHRHSVRRAQTAINAPYGEIHGNTIAADLLPIDMLRCKLSFFGATHFDPRSDRWVRICLFGNAPYPEDLADEATDDWPYPPLP